MAADHAATRDTSGAGFAPYLAQVHQRLLQTSPRPGFDQLDGTLVFADVSGFTPLTERLAKRGKIGAEELTDVLNSIFGTLLDRATEFGGDLLKFGGDALLLLFDGDGHEARACAAALAMQGALRPFRRLKTASGTVSLRMSVGVNSGPILLFLVGSTHQELLIAGPTMSRLVELESAADAGEVLVGATTASVVERRWLSEVTKDGGTLLRRVVRVLPTPASLLEGIERATDGAVDGIPTSLRSHLAVRHDEGEHRVAVLTFLQFKGVDRLLEDAGPETVRDLLHDLVTRVQHAADRHGVHFLATDLDKDGGKILLSAGAPTASEDDEDRTLATLLDVLDHLPEGLMVRAGVNRGRAFAVDIGNERRRTYAVMGDPTNLAARVMGKAEPGGILATDGVLARVRARYELMALEPFLVKGKSQPISARRVRRLLAPAGGRAVEQGPLVGRDHERHVLDQLVRRARQGQPGVVELVAEPGMGKSTLVDHLRRSGLGMGQFNVEGTHYAATSPYLALRGPLRRAFTGLDVDIDDATTLRIATSTFAPHLEPYVPLLGILFGLDLPATAVTSEIDPEFRRSILHMVAIEILRAALPQPTLLVVEDAHWLDDASADLLSALLADAEDRPWAACVTRRPEEVGLRLPSRATRLVLSPLDDAGSRAVVEAAGVNLAPSVAARLIERSGGSPLFLQELLAGVRDGQDVDDLPDSVEASIASRIDALTSEDRTLLRHAAVLGGRFTITALAQMLDVDEAATAAAIRSLDAFVEPDDDAWRFRHALVRECAYESLPFRRRRALHLRAGEILEERLAGDVTEWSDLLSLHFSRGGDDERSWRYSRMAGQRAQRTFAPVEAATFFRRAADAARRVSTVSAAQLGTVYETLGDCLRSSAQYTEAIEAYRSARRIQQDPLRIADLHRKEGMVRERTGRFADALRWYTRGRRMLEDLEPRGAPDAERVLAQLSVSAGAARLRQGRYLEGIPLLEQAAELAERHDDQETLAHAYDLLDWAHTDLGNEDRHRYRELSLPILERLGNLQREGVVASNLGIDAYFEGRWDDAVRWYERGRAASERAGDVVQMATALNNLGEVESDRGHLGEARARFETARRIWRGAPFPIGVALATSNLGRLAVRAGDLEGARRLLEEAREDFGRIGAESYVLETDVRELERLVAAEQPDAADELATDITHRAARSGGLPLQLLPADRSRAYAWAQRGALREALALLEDVVARAEALTAGYELALTLEALGRIGTAAGDGRAEGFAIAAGEWFTRLGVTSTPGVPFEPKGVPTPA